MKKVAIGILAAVVIIVVGVFFLFGNLGSLLKGVIETAGTEVTDVKVTLDEVDVDKITDGRAALRGLVVANPGGYKTNAAFSLGEVSVQLDPKTVARTGTEK